MVSVVIFNERRAEIAEKYLRKGSKVYLEGALQTRKWSDNSGQERYTTEIVLNRFRGELTMLDGAGAPAAPLMPQVEGGNNEGYDGGFGDEPTARGSAAPARARTPVNDLDDDHPFLSLFRLQRSPHHLAVRDARPRKWQWADSPFVSARQR